jgi:hypothetical protein
LYDRFFMSAVLTRNTTSNVKCFKQYMVLLMYYKG